MKRIAKFYKISQEQFIQDWKNTFGEETENHEICRIYEEIKLPCRATAGSAGYDFFLPLPISLSAGESAIVPTGIRVRMCEGWVLQIYPRSGLGFKYHLQMYNTVGIIDSDYYFSDNEGHIFIKILNGGKKEKPLELSAGMAFAQGVFTEYGLTEDDDISNSRNGGFGSTGV